MKVLSFKFPRHYAQGARCGHLEGKDRVGQYVIGEEHSLADEAAAVHAYYGAYEAADWAAGYRMGYRCGASGEPLPNEIVTEELP